MGNLSLCKRIVQEGVDLERGYRDCNGCTPLLYSLLLQQPAIAEHLALEGAVPAGKCCQELNPLGYSAFHLAASRNYQEILHILLERHPHQYLRLNDPIHPLHLAIVSQATECVSSILTHAGTSESPSRA